MHILALQMYPRVVEDHIPEAVHSSLPSGSIIYSTYVRTYDLSNKFGGKFEDVWMGWNECRGIGRFVDGGSEESFDGGSLVRGKGCMEAGGTEAP